VENFPFKLKANVLNRGNMQKQMLWRFTFHFTPKTGNENTCDSKINNLKENLKEKPNPLITHIIQYNFLLIFYYYFASKEHNKNILEVYFYLLELANFPSLHKIRRVKEKLKIITQLK
jgi:hypothetical protein